MLEFLIILALIWLIFASISDLKKREVPNWLNFSLIIFALAYRAFYFVFYSDLWFFVYGLFGFAVFFVLANLFYYARIFAGGDAKLLMALGTILPFASSIKENLWLFFIFILLLMFIGGVYGLIYSFFIVLRNKKVFWKEFVKQLKVNKKLFYISLIFAFFSLILTFYFFQLLFLAFPILFSMFPFLFIYAKAVEKFMIVSVSSKDVTVGDWLYEKVRVGKKKIKPCWEGLSEEEVNLLRKYEGKVKIKLGIPFVPAFLVAFILFILLWFSNWGFFKLF